MTIKKKTYETFDGKFWVNKYTIKDTIDESYSECLITEITSLIGFNIPFDLNYRNDASEILAYEADFRARERIIFYPEE